MGCVICNHSKVADIENQLLAYSCASEQISLAEIAKTFDVPLTDLQVHALMHTSTAALEADNSLVADIKKREAGMLSQLADEYWVTLRATGRKIREHMNESPRMVTKDMVELYLGTGANIRQTMQAIVDMNQKVNGENDRGLGALADVLGAIHRSAANQVVTDD